MEIAKWNKKIYFLEHFLFSEHKKIINTFIFFYFFSAVGHYKSIANGYQFHVSHSLCLTDSITAHANVNRFIRAHFHFYYIFLSLVRFFFLFLSANFLFRVNKHTHIRNESQQQQRIKKNRKYKKLLQRKGIYPHQRIKVEKEQKKTVFLKSVGRLDGRLAWFVEGSNW